MDVHDILAAMAVYIQEKVPGVKRAIFPPPDRIEQANIPAVVLFWGGTGEDTTIEHVGGGDQLWNVSAKAQILTPAINSTPAQLAVVDGLVIPLVDAFSPWGDGMSPVSRLAGLGGHVDRILPGRTRNTLMVDYAGSDYYCAEVFFSIKFHRLPTLPQEAP